MYVSIAVWKLKWQQCHGLIYMYKESLSLAKHSWVCMCDTRKARRTCIIKTVTTITNEYVSAKQSCPTSDYQQAWPHNMFTNHVDVLPLPQKKYWQCLCTFKVLLFLELLVIGLISIRSKRVKDWIIRMQEGCTVDFLSKICWYTCNIGVNHLWHPLHCD